MMVAEEKNSDHDWDSKASLFLNPFSTQPMDNIAIGGTGKPTGCNPESPYALVLVTGEKDAGVNQIEIPIHHGDTARYCALFLAEGPIAQFELITLLVHYQLFTQVGEDVSKTAFNLAIQAIGRIEILRICPPPESVKRCIARVEDRAVYAYRGAIAVRFRLI
jgi:hypothetical protein